MNTLYVVLGLLVVVSLMASHAFAYVRGFRKGEHYIYWAYFRPMASRFERNRRETMKLALLDDQTAAQQNVVLYLEKRKLWNKALTYVYKTRGYRRQLRRKHSALSDLGWIVTAVARMWEKK